MDRISINRDYKPERDKTEPAAYAYRHHLLTAAGIVAGIAIIFGLAPAPAGTPAPKNIATSTLEPQSATTHSATDLNKVSLPLQLPTAGKKAAGNPPASPPANSGHWQTATVKPGDNLSLIFKRLHIPAKQLQEILALGGEVKALKRLYPGDTLRLYTDGDRQLQQLVYDLDVTRTLKVTRSGEDFASQLIEHQPTRRSKYASGTIDSSLFLAAQRAGLSDNLIMELAAIFGWDVDFSLNIRQGDRFTVIYEELYLNGEKLGDGNILAAEFINRGKIHRALRFTDAKGKTDYYSPDGKSMRKEFLRSPVDFTRVSSRFTLGRKHPILNRIRAHKGVDYAAPRGTPIKATGDGKIIFRGIKGGYGKTVIIKHGSRYSTLYAHMSGFARSSRTGRHVRQGQVIGYVGSTGLATGPHLHYEFRVNGVHRNPLTVKLPDASPLPRQYLSDFSSKTHPFLAQLDLLRRSTLALNVEQH